MRTEEPLKGENAGSEELSAIRATGARSYTQQPEKLIRLEPGGFLAPYDQQ
jgi:hypothetical protein